MVDSTNGKAMPIIQIMMLVTVGFASIVSACTSNVSRDVTGSKEAKNFNEKPFSGAPLWRFQDTDTTVYLFGVAEIFPPNQPWQSKVISTALGEADVFILETNDGPETQASLGSKIQSLGLFRGERTLRDTLNDQQEVLLSEALAEFGVPLAALDQLKPWLATIQVGALHAQKQGYQNWVQGLLAINTHAKEHGNPVRYFEETRGELLEVFNDLPEDTQVKMLMREANQIMNDPDFSNRLADTWLQGDVDALTQFYHGEGQWADQIIYDALLVNRNAGWVNSINEIISEETGVFFVGVGMGHMLGPDGLISMLKEQGLQIVRQ